VNERANEGVLKDVLCVFAVAKDLPYATLQRRTVSPAQLHEGVLIPVFGGGDEVRFTGSLITEVQIIAFTCVPDDRTVRDIRIGPRYGIVQPH
jgi:hypothetical protein